MVLDLGGIVANWFVSGDEVGVEFSTGSDGGLAKIIVAHSQKMGNRNQ